MAFYSSKNFRPIKGHDYSDVKSVTQKYGYVPVRKQIEDMMLAGKRLEAFNAGRYMYDANGFDNVPNEEVVLASALPYYNDKLSIEERGAFLSGVLQARKASSAELAHDAEAKALNEAKFERLYNALVGTPTATEQVSAPKPDSTEV